MLIASTRIALDRTQHARLRETPAEDTRHRLLNLGLGGFGF